MTIVNFDLSDEIAAAGFDVSDGQLLCRYANEFTVGQTVVTTKAFTVDIVDGVGSADVYPTSVGNGLVVRVPLGSGPHGVRRRVVEIPDSPTPVEFTDLVEVDPKTLVPPELTDAVAQGFANLQEQIDDMEASDVDTVAGVAPVSGNIPPAGLKTALSLPSDTVTSLAGKQATSEKGQAGGYASLDGGGKIPTNQLPSSVMDYLGTWNAATNTPTLADGTGSAGDTYRVSVEGTRNLGSGSIDFKVGDLVIYSGTTWERSDSTDAVTEVAGLTGTVTAAGLKTALSLPTDTATDISELDAAVSALPATYVGQEGGATGLWVGTQAAYDALGSYDDDVLYIVDDGVGEVAWQPLSTELTAIDALDTATANVIASDGAGWVAKTYAQLKTALALVKGDVGLGSVDNTSDAGKPVSTATQTALDAKVPTSRTVNGHALSADVTVSKSDVGLSAVDNYSIDDLLEWLDTGQETMSRLHISTNSVTQSSGALRLTYFTARKSETITQVRTASGGQATGTPTLVRIGLYTVAGNGDLTLVASTPNDTALFIATNTAYTKSFSASYAMVAGQRYALGTLTVATTAQTMVGQAVSGSNTDLFASPRMAGQITGQTDLPSNPTNASITSSGSRVYGALLP